MIGSIKEIVIPYFRSKGFSGSYPHFKRQIGKRLDFISFQFNKYGGSFVIEIGYCSLEEAEKTAELIGVDIKNFNTFCLGKQRLRIGAADENSDYWFVYDNSEVTEDESVYEKLAKEAVVLFDRQADAWYNSEGI